METDKKVRLDCRIDPTVKAEAETRADQENRSLSNHVETVLKRDNEKLLPKPYTPKQETQHQTKKEYGKE